MSKRTLGAYEYRITIRKPCESNKLLRLLDLLGMLDVIYDRQHNPIGQLDEFTVRSPVQLKHEDFLPNGVSVKPI